MHNHHHHHHRQQQHNEARRRRRRSQLWASSRGGLAGGALDLDNAATRLADLATTLATTLTPPRVEDAVTSAEAAAAATPTTALCAPAMPPATLSGPRREAPHPHHPHQARHHWSTIILSLLVAVGALHLQASTVQAQKGHFLDRGRNISCPRGQPVNLAKFFPDQFSIGNCINNPNKRGGWISCRCLNGKIVCNETQENCPPQLDAILNSRQQEVAQPQPQPQVVVARTTKQLRHNLAPVEVVATRDRDYHDRVAAETLGMDVDLYQSKLNKYRKVASDRTSTTRRLPLVQMSSTTTSTTTTTTTTTTTPEPTTTTTTDLDQELSTWEPPELEEPLQPVEVNRQQPTQVEDLESEPTTTTTSSNHLDIGWDATGEYTTAPPRETLLNSMATGGNGRLLDEETRGWSAWARELATSEAVFYVALGAELLVLALIFGLIWLSHLVRLRRLSSSGATDSDLDIENNKSPASLGQLA